VAKDKLLAEWFWIDRWVGSSAFSLPIDARGLYREMLSQAWRRQARLPNDLEQIRRMTGVTMREWKRLWPQVKKYWKVDGNSLVNKTQQQVYAEAKGRADRATSRAQAAAEKRWAEERSRNAQGNAQASPKHSTSDAQAMPSDHRSPVQEPPNPLSAKGGRLTRQDLKDAKEIRTRAHAGCPHDPRCENFDACVRAIALERKARAS